MVCDLLASKSSSRKKHLENFSKIWVFDFLATHFGDLFASREFIQRHSRLTGEWKSQSRKRLNENFQNLVQGILATQFGDSLASHLSREPFWVNSGLKP